MGLFDSIRFTPGRPLIKELGSERLNAIVTEIKRNKPKGERGITVRQDGTGTYIGLAASLPQGGSSTPATIQPWDLQARVDPDADPENPTPPYLVRVRPGTLNGILPTNWDIEEECAGTGLFYAKAVVATDGEAITGVTIEIDGTPPTVQQPVEFGIANPVEYLFGLFLEGSVYRVIGAGHITISPKLWLTTEKQSPPAPGELPFEQYFTLR
jgi:hypothetical protein